MHITLLVKRAVWTLKNQGIKKLIHKTIGYVLRIKTKLLLILTVSKMFKRVDIIVPVYNGKKLISNLLESIPRTSVSYRLFLVDDCSTDKEVLPYLQSYKKQHRNTVLIHNQKNLGYTNSINLALRQTKNNVVLLNTDVRLPNNWLERLIVPIIADKKIATVTPFTNSGTICSFPNFLEDNELYLGLSVDDIDRAFSKLTPNYTQVPTGVGFCMAISRVALDMVGLLDEETFSCGYGEENDWCQRAIQNGFKNVIAENLFVYHQHGGSFSPTEKQSATRNNYKKLLIKHPNYENDVKSFCNSDPLKHFRDKAQLLLYKPSQKIVLAFNHNWGGGASYYLDNKEAQEVSAGTCFLRITYVADKGYRLSKNIDGNINQYYYNSIDDLLSVLPLNIIDIVINELVSYPDLFRLQSIISSIKKKYNNNITYYLHDYYCICPSYNLVNSDGIYCKIPSFDICKKCTSNTTNMFQWRKAWLAFLSTCDDIVVFSNDSVKQLLKAYPAIESKIRVIPHVVPYIRKVNIKPHREIIIGIIGIISDNKGLKIIEEMCRIIDENKLNIKVCIIGYTVRQIHNKCFSIEGPYARDDLPGLIEKHNINILFIPSIWPESFSYTTSECIQMGLPVVCFNIGAPPERVSKYDKGIIVNEISAEAALNSIRDFFG